MPSSTAAPAASTSTSPWSAWRSCRAAAVTGSSPPTAASSATAMPPSTAAPGSIHLNQTRGRDGRYPERQGLLARGRRRRHLQLRRCELPRQHGQPRAQQADHRHDHRPGRRRLLPRRLRRGHLQLRHGTLLRIAGRPTPQEPDCGRGGHADRQRLLVHRLRGIGVEFRIRRLLRLRALTPLQADRGHGGGARHHRCLRRRDVPLRVVRLRHQQIPVRQLAGGRPSDRHRAGGRELVGEHQSVPGRGAGLGGQRPQLVHVPDLRHVGHE